MKKILSILALLLLSGTGKLFAESSFYIPGVQYVTTAPSGSCGYSPTIFIVETTGAIWGCISNTYTLLPTGGGSGTITGTLTSGYYPIATGTHTLGNGTIDFGVTGPDLLYISAAQDSSTDMEFSAAQDIYIAATRQIQLSGTGGFIGIDSNGSIEETANGGGGSLWMYGSLGGATYLEDGGGTSVGPYANYDYVSMSNSNGSTTGELQENFIQKYQLIQLGTKSLFDYNVTNPDQVTLDATQDASTTLYSVSSGETDMVAASGGTAELVLGDPSNGTELLDSSANGITLESGLVQIAVGTTFQVLGNFSIDVLDFGVTTSNVLTLAAPVLTSGATATTGTPGAGGTNVATQAYADASSAAAVVPYAPLASPSFTGTVTASGEITGPGHWTTQPNSGANLCASATLSGTGWSGSGVGPYTHTSGTTALTASGCTSLAAGQSYLITWVQVAGGGGTVTPTFGGLTGSAKTASNTYTFYGTATSTTTVAFTPTTGFTGTVSLEAVVAQGPKATSCGTPVIVQGSTDRAGKLTTAASGCVVTFQTAYTNAPSCHFMADTAVTGDASQAVTNSSLTVTAVGMTAFDYECIGLNE